MDTFKTDYVAQLDNASYTQAVGHGFKPRQDHYHIL